MISTNNIFRRFLVGCWRYYKRFTYSQNAIQIDFGVEFNPQTKLGHNIWIHHHTNIKDSEIGNYTYIQDYCKLERCKIGSFCSIGDSVKVLSATHPTRDFVSTSPVFFSTAGQCGESFVDENLFDEYRRIQGFGVVVGNDVWIGSNSILLGGITVGNGAIIAAGSVVNKNVPPYAIVGGVPAKVIRFRFSDAQISELLKRPWWEKSEEWLKQHACDFKHINDYLKI
ncbi:CatB-related O-acetyltransferase [Bacteroides acidifaciens]|uniref:CatB-related O-acetyltransferase n=1 Tax=Bacteroides acidifaciens TaxID=85831 RepID=UPI002591AA91|nr:CatB-related O-acetyltransferase [Bacteroides acidifaciens]